MEALLSGAYKTLIPAATGSTVLLLINAGLLRYVFRFDRDAHGEYVPASSVRQLIQIAPLRGRKSGMNRTQLQTVTVEKQKTPLQIFERTRTRELCALAPADLLYIRRLVVHAPARDVSRGYGI